MKKPLVSIFAAIAVTTLFSGCLGLGLHLGGGKKTTTENNSKNYSYDVTLGQQLIDLQKAYDSGIITQSQYNHEKKKLMKEY